MRDDLALASLISSRICHDLISPVGAIGNGLELLAMSGAPVSEEVELITDSARTAAASLRFMRIAFGAASSQETIARRELGQIASAYLGTARLSVVWPDGGESVGREAAKLTLLAAMCAASALPIGGQVKLVELGEAPLRIVIDFIGDRAGLDAASEGLITGAAPVTEADPRQAPLALLKCLADASGYRLAPSPAPGGGRLTLS